MAQHLKIKTKYLKNLNMDLYKYTWELTAQVPRGRVTTYGAIANALGDIRAARAVGVMEHANPTPIVVPCHRVVYSDGGLGGFGAPEGVAKKIELLKSEGIKIRNGKIVNFKDMLFDDFTAPTPQPLAMLRKEQQGLRTEIDLTDTTHPKMPRTIAGIDVSYTAEEAFGAIAVLDIETLKVLETQVVQSKIRFPYITTFLSYHELPVAIELLKLLSSTPDLILFDGNGVLHPYGMGLATHGGIILETPTIGVAKRLLCGRIGNLVPGYKEVKEIILNNNRIGYSLKPPTTKKNLVYLSPGNHISFERALNITHHICRKRTPEPTRIAHALALENRKISGRF
ncbi:endonuclease V [[Eubacterium] cellulosolvens]